MCLVPTQQDQIIQTKEFLQHKSIKPSLATCSYKDLWLLSFPNGHDSACWLFMESLSNSLMVKEFRDRLNYTRTQSSVPWELIKQRVVGGGVHMLHGGSSTMAWDVGPAHFSPSPCYKESLKPSSLHSKPIQQQSLSIAEGSSSLALASHRSHGQHEDEQPRKSISERRRRRAQQDGEGAEGEDVHHKALRCHAPLLA